MDSSCLLRKNSLRDGLHERFNEILNQPDDVLDFSQEAEISLQHS